MGLKSGEIAVSIARTQEMPSHISKNCIKARLESWVKESTRFYRKYSTRATTDLDQCMGLGRHD